jgi:hypothetical protein
MSKAITVTMPEDEARTILFNLKHSLAIGQQRIADGEEIWDDEYKATDGSTRHRSVDRVEAAIARMEAAWPTE